jgi:hypothetical protein
MIPKSTSYKLVKDNVVIAEGSKKDMMKLMKKTPDTKVWLTSIKIGCKVR